VEAISNIYTNLKGDKSIWFIVLMLGVFSILSTYSSVGNWAYIHMGGNTEYYLIRQSLFVLVGFACMYMAYKFNYMSYSKIAPLLLLIAIPLLLYTLFFGVGIHEARRWVKIPLINQTFQTSDLARLALIIYIARSIAKKQDNIKDLKSAFIPLVIPVVLVCMLIAPMDLSTAALLFVTCFLMMIIGRVSLKYVVLLALVGLAGMSLLVLIGTAFPEIVRLETWISRITDFLNGSAEGWQIEQSKIAVANGELFGMGPGNSIQRNFLPYAHADFIFAIICEEYGVVGAFAIIFMYIYLLFRCTSMITRSPKTFGSILAIGLCLNIVVHALAHIGVCVNVLPATGLTLPIISMGGTSVIFTCISLGIILSVSRYVEEYSAAEIMEEEQTFDEEEEKKARQFLERNNLKHENYY